MTTRTARLLPILLLVLGLSGCSTANAPSAGGDPAAQPPAPAGPAGGEASPYCVALLAADPASILGVDAVTTAAPTTLDGRPINGCDVAGGDSQYMTLTVRDGDEAAEAWSFVSGTGDPIPELAGEARWTDEPTLGRRSVRQYVDGVYSALLMVSDSPDAHFPDYAEFLALYRSALAAGGVERGQ